MASAGERNKVMKFLEWKGFDPNIIEDPAAYTVQIASIRSITVFQFIYSIFYIGVWIISIILFYAFFKVLKRQCNA